MFPFPQRTDCTSVERLRRGRRAESHRRRVARPGLFDRLEPRTLLSATDPGWALRAGGPQNDICYKDAVDRSGNSYYVGLFNGSADFNGDGVADLTSAGGPDGFIAKYAPDGTFQWATRMGGPTTSTDNVNGVTVGSDGFIYITGGFWGTATFGGSGLALTSKGGADTFVAKLDPATGQFLWADRMGGTASEAGNSVAADADGVFITGSFGSTADFGPFTLTASGSDVYVAHLDTSGSFLWVKQMGGSAGDAGQALTCDSTGNVFVTGTFNSATANFGGITLTNHGGTQNTQDIFVAKVRPSDGSVAWAVDWGGTAADTSRDLVTDPAGNVYVAGQFNSTASFGPYTLTASGSDPRGAFVAALDSNGNTLWASRLSAATEYGVATGITIAPSGALYVTGGYGAPIAAFRLTKLDTSGNINRQQSMVNTTGGSYAGGIAADSDGLLYVGGSFTAPMAIDTGDRVVNLTPDPASTLSNGDIYVLKYNPNLARISGVVYGDFNDDGTREAEPGEKGWTVSLTDSTGAVVQTTTTDLDGNYTFSGPAPGTYTVGVSAPAGWQPTNPTGGSQAMTVSSGQNVSQYFGFYTPNAALTRTNSTSQFITSGSTASSTLNVTDAKSILDLNVQLNISYPVDSDLTVALVAPDGTKVTLFANVGSGMNFTNTVLDSEASTSIASGASPFTGTFRPMGDLAAFYGKSTQGVWTLQVTEANTKRRGTLNSWSLNFVVPTTAGMTSAAVRSAPGGERPAVVAPPTGPTAVAQAPLPLTVAPPSPGTQSSRLLISLTPPSDQDLTLLAAELTHSGTRRHGTSTRS